MLARLAVTSEVLVIAQEEQVYSIKSRSALFHCHNHTTLNVAICGGLLKFWHGSRITVKRGSAGARRR